MDKKGDCWECFGLKDRVLLPQRQPRSVLTIAKITSFCGLKLQQLFFPNFVCLRVQTVYQSLSDEKLLLDTRMMRVESDSRIKCWMLTFLQTTGTFIFARLTHTARTILTTYVFDLTLVSGGVRLEVYQASVCSLRLRFYICYAKPLDIFWRGTIMFSTFPNVGWF